MHVARGYSFEIVRLIALLLRCYRFPFIGAIAEQLVLLLGADIPRSVRWGAEFHVKHRGLGVVLHPKTVFRDRCVIMQGVTLGRQDVGVEDGFAGIRVGDRVTIGANAVVLAPNGGLTLARGTIVGAGSVLTEPTGEWEVWAGNPARKVGMRVPPDIQESHLSR
jgi:serine O-acetyltransferase